MRTSILMTRVWVSCSRRRSALLCVCSPLRCSFDYKLYAHFVGEVEKSTPIKREQDAYASYAYYPVGCCLLVQSLAYLSHCRDDRVCTAGLTVTRGISLAMQALLAAWQLFRSCVNFWPVWFELLLARSRRVAA